MYKLFEMIITIVVAVAIALFTCIFYDKNKDKINKKADKITSTVKDKFKKA